MKFLDDISIMVLIGGIMTEKLELYKCHICGNLVQVLLNGVGELVCCGQNMEHLEPHQEENNELAEKHVPRIEQEDGKRFVRLKYHPMIPEHYIQFIEIYPKDPKYLKSDWGKGYYFDPQGK